MPAQGSVFQEVVGLYRIIPLRVLRRTPGVLFDAVPIRALASVDAIDRVLHEKGAISPGPVGSIARPWYMHPHQIDHLLVLNGQRIVDLYTPAHGRIETLQVSPEMINKDGAVVYDGPAILAWPTGVFHRIISDEHLGSASLNFAARSKGFDIRTNFNIYDVNLKTGAYQVIREGHLDQPAG